MSDQNRVQLSDQEKIDRAAFHEEVRFIKNSNGLSQLRELFFWARSLRPSAMCT